VDVDWGRPCLIYGENFRVLAALLNSGMEGRVDLVYIDPPFNTSRHFTAGPSRASTVSRSADGDVAYTDRMDFPGYLEFIRERVVLLRDLLSRRGSLYLHIDCKVGHYVKVILDEVFGPENFRNDISRIKSNPKNFGRKAYGNRKDIVLFYAKRRGSNIFNDVTACLGDGEMKRMFRRTDVRGRRYNTVPAHAPGETAAGRTGGGWRGMLPPEGRHWRTDPAELERLDGEGRIEWSRNGVPRIINYADEHKGKKIQDIWDCQDPQYPRYPTEKSLELLDLIVRQSSDAGSVVLDCFAGSGTTLVSAGRLDRRWIGVDNSPVAIESIRKRLGAAGYAFHDLSRL
jgi:adenine-specific DNA-methyltransferase